MFLIVEIVNDKGEKEWKVAPKRWVCTSKNTQRPVLFWPHEFSAERQNQLAIEGTCKPLQSWMRRECVVKQEFPTYEAANTELQALLSQNSNQIKEELEDPLNVEDTAVESSEPSYAPGSDEDVSTLASIKSMLQSLITKSAQIEKQNVDVVQQNYHIESIICNLHKRVEIVESKFTSSVHSFDQSCNEPEEAIRQQSSKDFFSFEPMKTVRQLQELENKLNDESFNTELVQFLLANVGGDNTKLRIKSCVDLLCCLELQLKIKWVWQVKLQNFLNLLKKVGETSSECVTFKFLANFFEKNQRSINSKFFGNKKKSEGKLTTSKENVRSNRTVFLEPTGTVEELRELEEKLNDESFNAELLKWLLFKVRDNNAPWRIKSCLDLLCSLELQSKLRWSAVGKSEKQPISELPNFVHLFKVVGKTPSEDVTHQGLAQCFTNHLKNSKQRYLMSLNRKRRSKWRKFTKKREPNGVASEEANSSIAANENSNNEIKIP